MAARAPTTTAMHALTLDHLSGGRVLLGLGLSGPQVVEGWYGRPFPRSPLTATREYVDVVRQVLRREAPVRLARTPSPPRYTGPDGTGLGKALKPITHPLRADVPVLLGAEGPKNIAQTLAIADGWLPLYWTPDRWAQVYALPDGLPHAILPRRPHGPGAALRGRDGRPAAGQGDARLLHRPAWGTPPATSTPT
ncbi:hypothetical protein STANM309S_02968 [Streptomyces tanashiensis]